MGRVKPIARLAEDVQRGRKIERLSVASADLTAERAAIEEIERDVPLALELAAVEHADDIAMLERRRRQRLVHEPLHEIAALRDMGMENLDGSAAPQHHVLRCEDGTHTTVPE
jgi:hypothetical protein